MNLRVLLFILSSFFVLPLRGNFPPGSTVAYELSGGRFGDNLIAFMHGKWMSHILGLPLIYFPFPYSDQLAFSKDPRLLPTRKYTDFKLLTLNGKDDFFELYNLWQTGSKETVVVLVPYYPESVQEFDKPNPFPPWTQVNWEDPVFLADLQASISPLIPIPLLKLPKDRVSVAIHVRTGVRYDYVTWEEFTSAWPLKGPPLSYYIDCLKLISDGIKKPLYAYLFTDHPNPSILRMMFMKELSGHDIFIDCRKEENNQSLNVLEDFFMMKQFDCLIRSDSNFSLAASKIFQYQIAISPLHHERKENDEIKIDKVLLELNSKSEFSKSIKITLPQ